jgi:protein TonB
VQTATAVNVVTPIYPKQARRYGLGGTVVLRVFVQADGRVGDVQVQSSSGIPEIDAAAVEAAKKSEYRAAETSSGTPVESWLAASYRFVP